jgi:hypothetical protein
MPKNPQEFADLLGAKLVDTLPLTGGGPFGMARLARIMHQRLTPSQGERPGRPTDARWDKRRKVQMTKDTWQQLCKLAQRVSTATRKVSPMQVAAQLLEEATASAALGDGEQRAAENTKEGELQAVREGETKTNVIPSMPAGAKPVPDPEKARKVTKPRKQNQKANNAEPRAGA